MARQSSTQLPSLGSERYCSHFLDEGLRLREARSVAPSPREWRSTRETQALKPCTVLLTLGPASVAPTCTGVLG